MPELAERLATLAAIGEARGPIDATFDFPHFPDLIPPGTIRAGPYCLQFATARSDLEAAQRLRYQVFNGDIFSTSLRRSGRRLDADRHDPSFHHLMVRVAETGQVIGTYRLQTGSMARARMGFYASTLFEIADVPETILADAVELGRACVDREHRGGTVLKLLWRGIVRYMEWNSLRYAFGCCSLSGTSAATALNAWKSLHARHVVHDRFLVRPLPHAAVLQGDPRKRPLIDADALSSPLPPLFEGYLLLGARVCSAPAFDHALDTTDFLLMLDTAAMDERRRASFFRAA